MTPVAATPPTRLVHAVLLWTLVWTTLRGLRLPSDFAEAHWLLDYRFGFMKRGLVGTLGWLGGELTGTTMSPLVIAVVSGLIHAGFLWVLWLLLRRIVAWLEPVVGEAAVLLVLVVASSPFVVMSAHLLGYFDALLFLLAVGACVLVMRGRSGWAGAVQAVAVLVHELYLLVGLPLVILALVRRRTATVSRDTKTWLTRADLVVLAPPALAAVALFVAHAAMDGAALRAQLGQHLDSFGFVATRSAFVALYQTTGFWEFFAQNRGEFLVRALDPRVLLSVGPTLLLAALAVHAALRLRAYGAASLGILAAILAPFALHAVAWDTERISALAIGNAIVALWLLAVTTRSPEPAAPPRPDLLALVAVPALLLNIFFRIPLMDGEAERFALAWRAVIYLPVLALAAAAIWRRPRNGNDHDQHLGPTSLALRMLAPYLAVGIFWIGLQDAWLTVLAYHAQILLWTRGRLTPPWRRPDRWLLALVPFALAGPVLLLVLPWAAVTDLSAWLAGYGLSGGALVAMIPYYGLVHPVLEQAHWAPLRRRTVLADPVFAAYHLLVLGTLLAPAWLALLLVVLTAASATWRILERRTGDGRLSVLAHLVADLGVVLVAWWWVVSGRP